MSTLILKAHNDNTSDSYKDNLVFYEVENITHVINKTWALRWSTQGNQIKLLLITVEYISI